MRCIACDKALPPVMILNDEGGEEDMCHSCLSAVYQEESDIVNRDYIQIECETDISGIIEENEIRA